MGERVRAAAVRQRGDRVRMVRDRVQTQPGRNDGPEYWTLPGGGIERDEDPEVAVRREIAEEVDLTVIAAREVARVPNPSGTSLVCRVEAADGEATLGVDDLSSDCPRMVGRGWVQVPPLEKQAWRVAVPLVI